MVIHRRDVDVALAHVVLETKIRDQVLDVSLGIEPLFATGFPRQVRSADPILSDQRYPKLSQPSASSC